MFAQFFETLFFSFDFFFAEAITPAWARIVPALAKVFPIIGCSSKSITIFKSFVFLEKKTVKRRWTFQNHFNLCSTNIWWFFKVIKSEKSFETKLLKTVINEQLIIFNKHFECDSFLMTNFHKHFYKWICNVTDPVVLWQTDKLH